MRSQVWLLVSARFRKNLFRALSTSGVVALSFVSLLAIQGISYATGNSLVSYSLSKLPAGQENITINSSQVIASSSQYQAADRYLRSKLKSISDNPVVSEIIYRELSDPHNVHYYFGAIDNLSSSVQLVSGRLPGPCSGLKCEVIQVGGNPKVPPRPTAFGLTIVGRGVIKNDLLFSGTLGPPVGTALLLGDGISGATAISRSSFSATDGWVQKIDVKRINAIGTDNFISRVVAIEDHLSIDFPSLIVTWPQDALSNASDQAVVFSGKLTLLNFAVVTLLLAFLSLIAIRNRRDHFQFRTSLSRIGIPKSTLSRELMLEAFLSIAIGTLLAAFISLFLPKILGGFGFQSGLSNIYVGWPRYLLLIVVGEALVFGLSLFQDRPWRRVQVIALAVSTLSFLLYLQQSHVSDSRYLTIPFLYATGPVLICFVALRLFVTFWRSRRREIFVVLKEFFGLWQGVASMVALTSLLAMLTLGYSSGLSQQVTTQARNLVPLDISLFTGSNLIRPLDLAGASDYGSLLPNSEAFPILRTGTSVRGTSTVSDTVALIGLPPQALGLADFSLKKFASNQVFDQIPSQNGIAVENTQEISVTLSGIPPVIDLLGWFLTPRGTHISAAFTGASAIRTLLLNGQVPSGSTLIAFEFQESSNELSRRLHAIGEGNLSVPQIKGTGSIVKVLFDKKEVILPPNLWGSQNFAFAFDGQGLYVQPKSNIGIPSVVTDPVTAASAVNGILTLLGAANTYFQARVVGISQSFPSAGDRFVVMNLSQMQSILGQSDLGSIDPIEVWVKTPQPKAYLQKLESAGFGSLTIQSRSALEKEFRANPSDVGTIAAYRTSLITALIVALLIVLSALPLLYREGRRAFFHLESVGATPKQLRAAMRSSLRTAALAGLAIGAVLGIVVGRIFVSSSIPYHNELLLFIVVGVTFEVAGRVLTRNLFTENQMEGSSS